LSNSQQSKFSENLASSSIKIKNFSANVNNCAPLNYSVFTKQVQLSQSTISGSITLSYLRGVTQTVLRNTHLNWPVDCSWGRTFGRDLKSENFGSNYWL